MVPTTLSTDTTQSSGADWTAIINNAINQIPSWIAVARNQPIPTAVPTGTMGGSIVVTPTGVAGSISPGIIIAGVIGVVALVYLLKR